VSRAGWLVQLTFIAAFGGDAFNSTGMLVHLNQASPEPRLRRPHFCLPMLAARRALLAVLNTDRPVRPRTLEAAAGTGTRRVRLVRGEGRGGST
jgi:hypothetical protein